MGFIQIIEYKTTRIDEVRALLDKYRANNPSETTADRGTLTRDRDRADTYVSIVEFESYEKAMANSARPETSEMAAAMSALCDGPPTFLNLDVLDQM